MLDDSPTSAEALYLKAESLRDLGHIREGGELFQAAARSPDPTFEPKRRRHAYSHAITCAQKTHDWATVEAIAREAVALFPPYPSYRRQLGEALLRQNRFDEAESILTQVLELDPTDQEAPLLLELAQAKAAVALGEVRVATWPVRQRSFENLKAMTRRYLLGRRHGVPFITPDTVFMTIGSCFAQNLARHLRALGRTVHATEIGEDVNSTYANRYLLEWVENGISSPATQAIDGAFGPAMRDQLRENIAASDVFVITLGVAPCFFRKDDGEFAFVVSKTATAGEHLYGNHVMRTTTIAENVENIRCIMDSVARLARRPPKFVLTVSPVPLGGTTERHSAVIADCISKSTLRLAADLVCAEETEHELYYWPSFEIVRWLSPHFGPDLPPAFGLDDGNTRHVSDWLVRSIIKLFVEFHSPHDRTEEQPEAQDVASG
jgi:hypothetical protein